MKVFRNTNDAFGEPGPWEAPSKESLADEMSGTLYEWANDKAHREDAPLMHGEISSVEHFYREMRAQFIAALEEVAP